jgi:CheY-like chemotaxis protein
MAKGLVLVVEDESVVRWVMSRVLREAGYVVAEVTRGDEAIELGRKIEFDAIVTDSHMPGLSGLELLEQMRREWPSIPILRVSGSPPPEGSADDRVRHLQKPFTVDSFLHAVEGLLSD